MSAADALSRLIRARYDECPPGKWPMEDSLAEFILQRAFSYELAVVHLPEPSYVDDPEGDGSKGYGFNGDNTQTHLNERGVYAYDGAVFDQWDRVTPAEARLVGSWWLAAADAAEAS